jgi:hypothetical protein
MPMFRCDFYVEADIVLPQETPEMLVCRSGELAVTLKNGPPDGHGHVTSLMAIVVGPAATIEEARDELRNRLAEQLDLLTFSTHSGFKITGPKRLMDWEAGQKERRIWVYCTVDERYPPEPSMDERFLDSVMALNAANPPRYVREALKYFRLGVLERQSEDQYTRSWLAVETIAEGGRGPDDFPITCPTCEAPLRCQCCDQPAMRKPLAKQLIVALAAKLRPDDDGRKEMLKRQFAARNALTHGRGGAWIEKKLKMPLPAIVDELAAFAWHGIFSALPVSESKLYFGHRDGNFAHRNLISTMYGSFKYASGGEHPPENEIPEIAVKMDVRLVGADGTIIMPQA